MPAIFASDTGSSFDCACIHGKKMAVPNSAKAAIQALVALVEDGFGEDD